jgi:hypothetical protein
MLRMKWMTNNGGRLTARWADEERRIPSCRSETLSKEPVKQGGPPGGLAQSFAAGTEDFCRMELPVHAGVQVHPESSGVTMLALRRALRLLHWAVLLVCLLPCSRLWGQDQDPPTAQPSGSNQEIPSGSPWSLHFQATAIPQGHGNFHSPYSSNNSLSPETEVATSFTSTFYVGRKLWDGAEVYVNQEVLAGNGLSHTLGIAGFPNGEIYRVDNPMPKVSLARFFIRQTWGEGDSAGGASELAPTS